MAKKSGLPMGMFVEVIEFVMEIEGINKAEQEFLVAWGQLTESSAA
ncbi:hypothetical protein HML84_07815 [Alcanivorax sp. IO_7]|nr:hypothetical protein HML84_07815 [Alcanivorax sp. IO_7]